MKKSIFALCLILCIQCASYAALPGQDTEGFISSGIELHNTFDNSNMILAIDPVEGGSGFFKVIVLPQDFPSPEHHKRISAYTYVFERIIFQDNHIAGFSRLKINCLVVR